MKKGKIFKTLAIFGTCLCAPLLLTGCGKDETQINFRVEGEYIQWTEDGKTWTNLIELDELQGAQGIQGVAGKQVEFNVSSTHIQWRYVGDETWNNLIALEDIKGKKTEIIIGEDGYWYIDGKKTDYMAENTTTCNITYTLDANCYLPTNIENTTIVTYGENIISLPIPTNDFGYEFDGWYSTTNGEITPNDGKITTLTPITRDITLKAVFKGFGKTHTTTDGLVYDNYNVLKSYIGNSEEITIPKATTKFASNFGNDKIKTINVYQTTLYMDISKTHYEWSFDSSVFTNLECVNILNDAESNNELTIAAMAFQNLTKLKHIYFADDLYLSLVGDYAFDGCSNLTYFGDKSLQATGDAMLGSLSTFGNITLGSSIFDDTLITQVYIYAHIIDNFGSAEYAFKFSTQLSQINYYGKDMSSNTQDVRIILPDIDGKHWENEDGTTITEFSESGLFSLVQD